MFEVLFKIPGVFTCAQNEHGAVMRTLSEEQGEQRRFVYRSFERNSDTYILARSSTPINGTIIEWREKKTTYKPGQCIRIRVKANPTYKVDRKKTHPIIKNETMKLWFERKLKDSGLKTLNQNFTILRPVPKLSSYKKNSPIFHSVEFSADCEVEDSSKLTNAMLSGIGPAKTYGFGMLVVEGVIDDR